MSILIILFDESWQMDALVLTKWPSRFGTWPSLQKVPCSLLSHPPPHCTHCCVFSTVDSCVWSALCVWSRTIGTLLSGCFVHTAVPFSCWTVFPRVNSLLSVQPSVDDSCFPASTNRATVNTLIPLFFCRHMVFSFLLSKYLRIEKLGHRVGNHLVLQVTARPAPKAMRNGEEHSSPSPSQLVEQSVWF